MPNTPPIDRATPTIKKATETDAEKIAVGTAVAAAVMASPNIGAAPDVAAAATSLSKLTVNLDTNAKSIAQVRKQLIASESKQRTNRRQWRAAKKQLLANADVYCNGSLDLVQSFSLDVITQAPATPGGRPPPDNILGLAGKSVGQVGAEWDRGLTRVFVVQWATDTANAATYSPNISCTKRTFMLSGQTTGAHIYFRVAAHDTTMLEGHGPWSAWVSAIVK